MSRKPTPRTKAAAEQVKDEKRKPSWNTKLAHASYSIEACPQCEFPEADGGYCPECGWSVPLIFSR